jgi:hypothetical protein
VLFSLRNARWWVWSLVLGTFFGCAIALVSLVTNRGESVAGAVVGGVVGGLVYGAILGPFVTGQRSRMHAVVGPLPQGREKQASRAAVRGPVPNDAEVRTAAFRLVSYRLAEQQRYHVLTIVGLSVLFVAFVLVGLFSTAGGWFGAAAVVFVLVAHFWSRRRSQRRLELLRSVETGR